MSIEAGLFLVFGGLAVFAALAMVMSVRNPLASVMSLAVTMVSLAGISLLLGAHFVAVVQIIVYAGISLVLLFFLVIVLDARESGFTPMRPGPALLRFAAAGLVVATLAALLDRVPSGTVVGSAPEGFGGHRALGRALFVDFVVPLELLGMLLLAALVGAVVLAKRGES